MKKIKTSWFDLTWEDYSKFDKITEFHKLELLSGLDLAEMGIDEYQNFIKQDHYWNSQIPTVNPTFIKLENGEIVSPVDLYDLSVAEYEDASNYLKEKNYAGVMSVLYRPVKPSLWDRIKVKAYLKPLENAYKKQDIDKITKYVAKISSMSFNIEKYDYKKTDSRIQYFNLLPTPYVYSAAIFFCLQSLNSKKISNHYSQILQTVQGMG